MTPETLHQQTPRRLDRVCVVLIEPSHPGNVGAAARAMRVMGLRDLVLVAPRVAGATSDPGAIAFASGALEVLAAARVVDTLDEAVADATLVVGVSADPREFGPEPLEPEAAATKVLAELDGDPGHRAALVFGPERTGLSIGHVGRCHLLCSIPGDPTYHSLNLAQAVQVMAYVMRRAALHDSPTVAHGARLATHGAIEGFYSHLERALLAIGFLDPAHPKKLMPRLRRLFSRARLEVEELDLLRGVCKMAEAAGRANPPPWKRGEHDDEDRSEGKPHR